MVLRQDRLFSTTEATDDSGVLDSPTYGPDAKRRRYEESSGPSVTHWERRRQWVWRRSNMTLRRLTIFIRVCGRWDRRYPIPTKCKRRFTPNSLSQMSQTAWIRWDRGRGRGRGRNRDDVFSGLSQNQVNQMILFMVFTLPNIHCLNKGYQISDPSGSRSIID